MSLAHPDMPRPLGQAPGRHRRPDSAPAAVGSSGPVAGRHHRPEPLRRKVPEARVAATVGVASPPAVTRPPGQPQRSRKYRRTRPSLRPAVSGSIAIVATSAFVGALTTPTDTAIAFTAVQQTAVVTSDPTPTPLLAALVDCANATAGQCPDNLIATALGALVNFAAVGADGALLTWDNVVNLGADVVANIALAPAALGVALSTGANLAIQNLLGLLAPLAGPITTPLIDGIATVAGDASAFFNVVVGGLGDAVAWKAQLDAVLADLVATGGVALVNGLTTGLLGLIGVVPGGLPDIDVTDAAGALGAVVNHVAVGLDSLLTGWDTAVNLGADIVATIGLTVSGIGTAVTGAVTSAVLNGIAALADIAGPLAAPVFTAITNVVTGVSGLVTTAFMIPGAALAWKAQLDAVLADLVADSGVALTNGLAGGLMGMVGVEPVGLPDIGFAEVCASLAAVVNHVTVGLAEVFTGGAEDVPSLTPDSAAAAGLAAELRAAPANAPAEPLTTTPKAAPSIPETVSPLPDSTAEDASNSGVTVDTRTARVTPDRSAHRTESGATRDSNSRKSHQDGTARRSHHER